jgi:hypothetical protein
VSKSVRQETFLPCRAQRNRFVPYFLNGESGKNFSMRLKGRSQYVASGNPWSMLLKTRAPIPTPGALDFSTCHLGRLIL